MSRWIKRLAFVITSLILIAPSLINAHGYIVRSIPGDQAELDRAPVRVQIWFSEALEPSFSSLTIRNTDRAIIAEGGVDPDDPALLSVRLPGTLADGAYLVELKIAFASDGHVIYETQTFFVGVSAQSGLSSALSNDLPVALEVVWRVLVLSSHMLLFGAFTLYTLVLIPAWGNPAYPAGLLPPRVMRRLYWLAGISLAVAFAGNGLALLQQSMVFFNTDAIRVISDGLWNIVRTGTRFGETWNARMIFLGIVSGLLIASRYVRREYPGAVARFWAANAWGMALILGTLSVSSHAAGSLTLTWMALISDWLHVLASGVWVGGVAALALVLPSAVQPLTGDARRLAMIAALKRFSPLAVIGLVLVIATGIYNTSNWLTEADDLTTTYGGTLALKVSLVTLLVGVGAAHHIALHQRQYAHFQAIIARVRGFIPTLRLETAFALSVLVVVGALSATPVPDQMIEGRAAPPPTAMQPLDALTVTTTISPGGPGVNTFDVQVARGNQPVNDLPVTLRIIDPARDWRSTLYSLEPLGDGLYTTASADIDRADLWWTLVQIDGQQIAYTWDIDQSAAVIASRPLNALNLLALIGVIGACAFALFPSAQHLYRSLDLSPASVTVAVSATAATIVLVIFTGVIISQTNAQYAAEIERPPQVINAVLPTDDSVMQGRVLALECRWIDAPDLAALTERLERTRDETLYAYTRDGWRTLPPCADSLTENDRWNLVNYIRSLER